MHTKDGWSWYTGWLVTVTFYQVNL